jgi:uncharacterized membrane protein YhaH (DUF805 family)
MKRHPLDPLSLVIGLLFAGVGAAFLVAQIHIGNANMRWVWPVALLGLGAVMIALGARRAADTNITGVGLDMTTAAPEEADPTVPG